jgi:hypothetical protein
MDETKRAWDEVGERGAGRGLRVAGRDLRDEEAQQHLRETGAELGDALKVTFSEVSEEIRREVGGRGPS